MKRQISLVRVTWLDAWSQGGWANSSEIRTRPIEVNSIGWVIDKNDKGIVIAACVDMNSKEPGNLQFIPTGMIKAIKKVTNGQLVLGE